VDLQNWRNCGTNELEWTKFTQTEKYFCVFNCGLTPNFEKVTPQMNSLTLQPTQFFYFN